MIYVLNSKGEPLMPTGRHGRVYKKQTYNKNIEVVESYRIAPSKFIAIVRTGSKYLVIGVGKDEISKLSEQSNSAASEIQSIIAELLANSDQSVDKIQKAKEMCTDREHALEEKKSELNEIVSENKQKEETLREKAKKQENKIEERLLTAFKRIRKNTRNGLGIVVVQRNACGGCFNRIPAQRQMEIKMHKKVIVCEYCGRILIDPELVGITPEDAKNK